MTTLLFLLLAGCGAPDAPPAPTLVVTQDAGPSRDGDAAAAVSSDLALPELAAGGFESPEPLDPDPETPTPAPEPDGWSTEGRAEATVMAPRTPIPGSRDDQLGVLAFTDPHPHEAALVTAGGRAAGGSTMAARAHVGAWSDGGLRPLPRQAFVALRLDGVEVSRTVLDPIPVDGLAPLETRWTVPHEAHGRPLEVAVGATGRRDRTYGPRGALLVDGVELGISESDDDGLTGGR